MRKYSILEALLYKHAVLMEDVHEVHERVQKDIEHAQLLVMEARILLAKLEARKRSRRSRETSED
jgi:hypothetical protein